MTVWHVGGPPQRDRHRSPLRQPPGTVWPVARTPFGIALVVLVSTPVVCNLPWGTVSDGINCDAGEAGCTVSDLAAAGELTCAAGFGGSPSKANAECYRSYGANVLEFTGATFCQGCACILQCGVMAACPEDWYWGVMRFEGFRVARSR